MKLNFGCGKKILKGWINADIQKSPKIDKSFDFNEFPYPFDSNTFDYIFSDNVLEHLDDPKKVLNELWRLSKKNGIIKIIVPYYHSMGAFNDVNHKHFFNERSIEILIHPQEGYEIKNENKFKIRKLELVPSKLGKFIYPKKIRYIVGRLIADINCQIDVELEVIK
jgi:ubiquinone/menaquinone biosynthesis C-methylase UbiE